MLGSKNASSRTSRLNTEDIGDSSSKSDFRVIGSVVYEDPATGELCLSFYSSSAEVQDVEPKIDYP